MDINEAKTKATLTVDEAAELLRVSAATAYAAIADGQLPSVKLGRRILIPTARLLNDLGTSTARDEVTAERERCVRIADSFLHGWNESRPRPPITQEMIGWYDDMILTPLREGWGIRPSRPDSFDQ